jgi:hypothetical protein
MKVGFLFAFLMIVVNGCNPFTGVPAKLQTQTSGGDTFSSDNELPEEEEQEFPGLDLGSVENIGADDPFLLQANNSTTNTIDARTTTGRIAKLNVNIPFDFDSEVDTIRVIRWGPFQKPDDFSNQERDLPNYQCNQSFSPLGVNGEPPRKIGPVDASGNAIFIPNTQTPADFKVQNRTGDLSLKSLNNNLKFIDGDKNFNWNIETARGENEILHDHFYVYLFCIGKSTSLGIEPDFIYKRIRVLYTLDGFPYPSKNDPLFGTKFVDQANTRLEFASCAENRSAQINMRVDLANPDARDKTLGPSRGFTGANLSTSVSSTFGMRYIIRSPGDDVTFSGPDTAPGNLNTSVSGAVVTAVNIKYSEGVTASAVLTELQNVSPTLVTIPFLTKSVGNNQVVKNTVAFDYKGDAITGAYDVVAELELRDLSQDRKRLFDLFGANNIFFGSGINDINLRGFFETPHFKGSRFFRVSRTFNDPAQFCPAPPE